jgi:hypothetical protein
VRPHLRVSRTEFRFRHGRAPIRLFLAALFVSTLAVAPPARAAWIPDGVPLSPMPAPAPPYQTYSFLGLTGDGAQGAYVTWEFSSWHPDFDPTSYVYAAQRVDVLGNRPAPWPASGASMISFQNTSSFGPYALYHLKTFEDGSGGAVMAAITSEFNVEPMSLFRTFRINPNATAFAIPMEFSSFNGFAAIDAAVAPVPGGGMIAIVLGQTFAPPLQPKPPSPLVAMRMDAGGQQLWDTPTGAGPELVPAGQGAAGLAALADPLGGGFFAWVDLRDAGDRDIYVQRLDAAGAVAPGWPAGGVLVCGAAGDQLAPHLAPDGAGGVFVEWLDRRAAPDRLYAHHLLGSGSLAPGIPVDGRMLPSSSSGDAFANMSGDGVNGCFIVRVGAMPALVSSLHRLDGALLPAPAWPPQGVALNGLSPSFGSGVGLVPDGFGGAYVSYRNGIGSAPPEGLYVQHFRASSLPAPGWVPGGYRLSGTGHKSDLVRSGGGAIVAWTDNRAAYAGVYAQRVDIDGPVATQMALVSAVASDGRVALRWFSADGPSLPATAERRTVDSDWAPITDIVADGTGYLEFSDLAVTPGERYGYRLAWNDGATRRTGGEAWLTLPAHSAFALASPAPNPSSGAVELAVSLPDSRPARLEVLDLAGRRLIGREVGGLGTGTHVVALDEAAALAPGVYVARLTRAGETRRVRMVRVR